MMIHDNERWDLQLEGRRIPEAQWQSLQDADRLIKKANEVWKQAQREADLLRQQGYLDGWEDGKTELLAQMAQNLIEAQQTARLYFGNAEQRVVDLAAAMVMRIAPNLPYDEVIEDLVSEGVRTIQLDRFLRVRVHPGVVKDIGSKLDVWRENNLPMDSVEVIGDPSISKYGCIVESATGVVRAGLEDQLNAMVHSAKQHLLETD